MNLELEHKNALVCGSTAGIGKATALMLAQEGANVTLLARNEDKLKAVLKELSQDGSQQHGFIVADFNHPTKVREAVNKRLDEIDTIHILVNNTGGPAAGPVYEASLDAFAKAFTQHLQCNQILAQTVIPGMKKAGYGRIINVISTSVKQPLDGLGVSNTIRGAVANWSKTLANEMGPFGITVNNVLPGATSTGRLSEIIENKAQKGNKKEEEVSESMKASVPARRFAEPEELGAAITFLSSARAAYINGINLPVDGGRTKCL